MIGRKYTSKMMAVRTATIFTLIFLPLFLSHPLLSEIITPSYNIIDVIMAKRMMMNIIPNPLDNSSASWSSIFPPSYNIISQSP